MIRRIWSAAPVGTKAWGHRDFLKILNADASRAGLADCLRLRRGMKPLLSAFTPPRARTLCVVLRILRRQDLAEEVIQEAYVKIWNGAGNSIPACRHDHVDGLDRPKRAIDVVRKRTELSIEEEPRPWKWLPHPDPLCAPGDD